MQKIQTSSSYLPCDYLIKQSTHTPPVSSRSYIINLPYLCWKKKYKKVTKSFNKTWKNK